MALTQYLNLNYDQIKASIKEYIRSNNSFRDFDYEGANLSILIDILAYNTYTNSYNANMIANECFLDSASLRENVISIIQTIGYTPRSSKSAKALISFIVNLDSESLTSTLTFKKGAAALGSVEESKYIFSLIEDVTIPVKNRVGFFENLPIYQGILLTQSFTVDNTSFDQKFILDNEKIDTSTIRVRVKESLSSSKYDEYSLVENIIGISGTSKIFLIKEVSDERYELIFGDGVIGNKLSNGNVIEVDYIVTDEELGNGVNNYLLNGDIVTDNGALINTSQVSVATVQRSGGGSKIENLKSIKNYGPKYLATQNRAITTQDYETLVPKIYPRANSVVAFGGETLNPPQYGKVFLSVKPDNSTFLSLFDKELLKTEIKKYASVGVDIDVIDLKYLYIELDISAYYSPNLTQSVDTIRTKISQTLSDYSESEDLNKFGGRFKFSNISRIIDETDSSITSNSTIVKLRRNISPVFNSQFSYECCFGNSIFNSSEYNVRTTGFRVFEYADIVYFSDKKDNDKTGTLFLFKLDESNNPIILKSVIGTINYETGELFIDSLNVVSTTLSDNTIQVEIDPRSYDAIGLRDLFITLSLNDTKITMIQDNISSGSDTSGVEFIATPVYKNQGYIRES